MNISDNKILEVFKQYDIKIFIDIGDLWFVVRDLCGILKMKNYSHILLNLQDNYKSKRGFYKNNRFSVVDVINKYGLFITLQNSRKPKAIEIAKKLNLNIILPIKEQQTLLIIINSIIDITPYILQYSIGNYLIDMYLPDLNIAIECDEFNHKNNNENLEIKRQTYIEESLNCKFIRYNPDDPKFNIGNVINQIFLEYIYKKR